MCVLGQRHGFNRAVVDLVVEEGAVAIARWQVFADAAGVTRPSRTAIAEAHAAIVRRLNVTI